jgi:RecG-like helicase
VYEVIKEEINSGGRAYIVCPLVNESDKYEDVRTVQDEFARLSSSGRVLLHGTTVPAASALTVL